MSLIDDMKALEWAVLNASRVATETEGVAREVSDRFQALQAERNAALALLREIYEAEAGDDFWHVGWDMRDKLRKILGIDPADVE